MTYLDYGNGINAGFSLSPATLQTCEITSAGSCTGEPILTVGLNADAEYGFNIMLLTCPPIGCVGPADIAGYPVCQKTIDDVTVSTANGSYTGGVIFDTGTSYVLSVNADARDIGERRTVWIDRGLRHPVRLHLQLPH